MRSGEAIEDVRVSVYKIPTDFPEADGTISWDSTTIIVVEIKGGDKIGIGYTYADQACGKLVDSVLSPLLKGGDLMAIPEAWVLMTKKVRNQGRPGIASMAISAVDLALWDLKARLLEAPLAKLLGPVRGGIAVYGSGGFTSYPIEKLQEQLGGWVAMGIPRVKMKIGTDPCKDLDRVRAARDAIGEDAELFVDANGAYSRKQALAFSEKFSPLGVKWFEEPVSSEDLEGLRLIRDRAPAVMDITAGEYGYDLYYFRRMLEAGAVDVLMADATRCGGVTGFLQVDALCQAYGLSLSAHTSPSAHLHLCCAAPTIRHVEYFHDHQRIEQMIFEGAVSPVEGILHPDLSRPGMGIELKRNDAERYAI